MRTHVVITTPCRLKQTEKKVVTPTMDWPHEGMDDTALTDVHWHCAKCFHELDLSQYEIDYDG